MSTRSGLCSERFATVIAGVAKRFGPAVGGLLAFSGRSEFDGRPRAKLNMGRGGLAASVDTMSRPSDALVIMAFATVLGAEYPAHYWIISFAILVWMTDLPASLLERALYS